MVGVVKDKTDRDSWFSAKPIKVGNFNNILAGTEFNLRQGNAQFVMQTEASLILYKLGDHKTFISEYVASEWQRLI